MLSAGAIAGIVIGSIVGVIVLIGVPTYIYLRSRKAAQHQAQIHGLGVLAPPKLHTGVPVTGPSISTTHGGSFSPYEPALPPHQHGAYPPIAQHGGGGSFDPSAPYAQPQSQAESGIEQHYGPHSPEYGSPFHDYIPAHMEPGDEPVNYGSMMVKGIRDTGDDQEDDALDARRRNI